MAESNANTQGAGASTIEDQQDDFVPVEIGDADHPTDEQDNTSEGSGESSGMGSFVDAGLDTSSGGNVSTDSQTSEPSLVMVENVEEAVSGSPFENTVVGEVVETERSQDGTTTQVSLPDTGLDTSSGGNVSTDSQTSEPSLVIVENIEEAVSVSPFEITAVSEVVETERSQDGTTTQVALPDTGLDISSGDIILTDSQTSESSLVIKENQKEAVSVSPIENTVVDEVIKTERSQLSSFHNANQRDDLNEIESPNSEESPILVDSDEDSMNSKEISQEKSSTTASFWLANTKADANEKEDSTPTDASFLESNDIIEKKSTTTTSFWLTDAKASLMELENNKPSDEDNLEMSSADEAAVDGKDDVSDSNDIVVESENRVVSKEPSEVKAPTDEDNNEITVAPNEKKKGDEASTSTPEKRNDKIKSQEIPEITEVIEYREEQNFEEDKSLNSVSNDGSILYVDKSASSVTSASQVTAVASNTDGSKRNIVAPSIAMKQYDVPYGIGDITSNLSSESFIKDKERLRLRKIALQSVATSISAQNIAVGVQSMTTVKETQDTKNASSEEPTVTKIDSLPDEVKRKNPFDESNSGAASKSTAEFDPYAVGDKEPASEVEMKEMDSSDKIPMPVPIPVPVRSQFEVESAAVVQSEKLVDTIPVPVTMPAFKKANSERSNSSAPTQTFDKLSPLRTQDGNFVDIGRLLVVGVAGAVGGVMLSHFSLTTCDFVTIQKPVGYYGEILYANAGMSSFTSFDAVFQGSSYQCIAYDDQYYGQDPPLFPKAMAALAMASGLIATTIVWVYIFTTKTTVPIWNLGRVFAIAAAVFQFLTLQFFFGTVCAGQACRIGIGSFFSFVASCTYAYMAYEMSRNCPVQLAIPGICKDYGGKKCDVDGEYYAAPDIV